MFNVVQRRPGVVWRAHHIDGCVRSVDVHMCNAVVDSTTASRTHFIFGSTLKRQAKVRICQKGSWRVPVRFRHRRRATWLMLFFSSSFHFHFHHPVFRSYMNTWHVMCAADIGCECILRRSTAVWQRECMKTSTAWHAWCFLRILKTSFSTFPIEIPIECD